MVDVAQEEHIMLREGQRDKNAGSLEQVTKGTAYSRQENRRQTTAYSCY